MRGRQLLLPMLGIAGFAATLGWLRLGGTLSGSDGAVPAAARAAATASLAPRIERGMRQAPRAKPLPGSAVVPPPLSEAQVRQLIDDTTDPDEQRRLKAIESLGTAPRAVALPVLSRIVTEADAALDRHVALSALFTLGMHQGDADGAIRELLRTLVYDGNDEAVSENAAAALDSLELPRGGLS
jgi:hypothetical protein